MVIAGAALIKGAKSLHLSRPSTSAAPRFTSTSPGAQDLRVPDDSTALQVIREEVGKLGSSAAGLLSPRRRRGPPPLPTP